MARCEYALLRDLDARLGWAPAVGIEDELLTRTAALGDVHERRMLEKLRGDQMSDVGDGLAVIGRPAYTPATGQIATIAAWRDP